MPLQHLPAVHHCNTDRHQARLSSALGASGSGTWACMHLCSMETAGQVWPMLVGYVRVGNCPTQPDSYHLYAQPKLLSGARFSLSISHCRCSPLSLHQLVTMPQLRQAHEPIKVVYDWSASTIRQQSCLKASRRAFVHCQEDRVAVQWRWWWLWCWPCRAAGSSNTQRGFIPRISAAEVGESAYRGRAPVEVSPA